MKGIKFKLSEEYRAVANLYGKYDGEYELIEKDDMYIVLYEDKGKKHKAQYEKYEVEEAFREGSWIIISDLNCCNI